MGPGPRQPRDLEPTPVRVGDGGASETRFTTDSFPAHEALDRWDAATTPLGFAGTFSDLAEPFRGSFAGRVMGPLLAAECTGSRLVFRRTPRDVARAGMDGLFLFQPLSPTEAVCRTRRLDDSHPRDLVIGDADDFFQCLTPTRYHHRFWVLPWSLMTRVGAGAGALAGGVRLPSGAGVGRLVSVLLEEAWGQGLAPDQAGAVGEAVARLVAVGGGARAEEPEQAASDLGELALVRRRIEARLTDPLLSPRRIAGACGVSVRKLHALFEPTGVSFSRYVLARRLERARRLLSDPAGDGRPISDIVFSLGFNSLATFYRAYGQAYGEAPGDTRARR